ncbi:uncharacterized protein G2W53_011026 [Senna tora]|uniref:Uncharacterized protein n=1 Tax=Senna tora TaxID=362788 RepID=A0A834X0S3_9FABA|nr:uncharacterized protein G2W53_011026 [Senna tora]
MSQEGDKKTTSTQDPPHSLQHRTNVVLSREVDDGEIGAYGVESIDLWRDYAFLWNWRFLLRAAALDVLELGYADEGGRA